MDDTNDNGPETPDDEDVMKELENAMREMHPDEEMKDDPFATDAFGHDPAPEHDKGNS